MENQLQVVTVKNVRGYIDAQGSLWINAEDAARGLGFTTIVNGTEYVRWNTVHKYLREFGFLQQVAKDSFIPENMFYRLAMKAKNETAERFQALAADEIFPSIRKHGAYLTPQTAEKILLNPDFIIKLAEQVKQAQLERDAALNKVAELQPKADYCDQILNSDEALTATFIAKDYGMATVNFNKLLHKLGVQFKVGKTWMLKQPYAGLGYMTSRTEILGNGLAVTHNYWTQKGRMFLYNTLKKSGIVPVCERDESSGTLFEVIA